MTDKKIRSAVLQLISQKNYITYNKVLAKAIGLEATIVFGELSSVSNIFGTDDFFCLKEQIEDDTCLTSRAVRLALKTLQETGLISIVKKGCPCKNYYTLHEDKLLEILSDVKIDTSSDTSLSGVKIDITSDIKIDTTSDIKIDTTFKKDNKEKIKENIIYPQEAIDLTQYLYNSCKEKDSCFKRTEKQLEKWTNEFDLLHRKDGREWSQIDSVLKWARNDDFWRKNILSAGTFREKFDRLYAQMLDDKPKQAYQPYQQKGIYDHIECERAFKEKLQNMTNEEVLKLF